MEQSNTNSILGSYALDGKKLTPSTTDSQSNIKCLFIRDSKKAGGRPYLSAIVKGDALPKFISSVYEPRTKDGWFNFESGGLRYEVIKQSDEAAIITLHTKNGNSYV